jgi:hypothetical protein
MAEPTPSSGTAATTASGLGAVLAGLLHGF